MLVDIYATLRVQPKTWKGKKPMADTFKPLTPEQNIESQWSNTAAKQLLGKRIVRVRYMTKEEADDMGWYNRPIVLQLEDGNIIYPSQDDEGNDGGALFTNDPDDNVIPVMRGA